MEEHLGLWEFSLFRVVVAYSLCNQRGILLIVKFFENLHDLISNGFAILRTIIAGINLGVTFLDQLAVFFLDQLR